MEKTPRQTTTRREFLENTGRAAVTSALAAVAVPPVHPGEDNTIRLALVGCGGRGTGAVADALSVQNGPIRLVAMADVFEHRLRVSHAYASKQFASQVDVPEDRRFIGFDGYRKAMDCLRPGDVVILTTPPAFRWVHFAYAVEKGLNVFMEKPVTVDGPTSRRMFQLGEESVKKNLKVAVGLMCRHSRARHELRARIEAGELGELIMLRAYRMMGHTALEASPPMPKDYPFTELLYQIQRFHSFLWASGGMVSDFLIHSIDECCWMKGAWPVKAKASGGRHYRGEMIDQNFDVYCIEYTFPDGTKLFVNGRTQPGCHQEFSSYAHGTKGLAIISTSGHIPARCRIYRGHNTADDALLWAFPQPESNPYRVEWVDLIAAIREDRPYNEVRRGVEASLITSMGRMAAHTGKVITRDQILHGDREFAPDVDKLTLTSDPPLRAGPDGKYPVPRPGLVTDREY